MLLSALLLASTAFVLIMVCWNMLVWPRVVNGCPGGPLPSEPRVSVLIPARNEAHNLPDCLGLALDQPGVLEVLVYDDASDDETPEVVRNAAQRDARVRLIHGKPLREGWCGKPFACSELAAEARGDWLLFLDADARLLPGAVPAIAAAADQSGVTLLSCWPGLEMRSFWEHTLMPMLNYCVFSLFPAPLSLTNWSPRFGLAHGACLFAARGAYEAVGGHAAVRAEIFEDTCLARHWRAKGQRGLCLDGQDVVRIRMYTSFRGIWRGFQKNFYPAFRRQSSFWAFAAWHAWTSLLPFVLLPWLAVTQPGQGAVLVVLAAACVLAARWALCARFSQPPWPGLLHPLAASLLLALGLSSWRRCVTGRGVEWKGRRYRTEPGAPPKT